MQNLCNPEVLEQYDILFSARRSNDLLPSLSARFLVGTIFRAEGNRDVSNVQFLKAVSRATSLLRYSRERLYRATFFIDFLLPPLVRTYFTAIAILCGGPLHTSEAV